VEAAQSAHRVDELRHPTTLQARAQEPFLTGAAWAFLVLFAVAAAGDWVGVARRPGGRALEYVCKPAALVALLLAAVALDPADGAQRAWFVVALAWCLAGDVFLMAPTDRFVPGLASFLVGHLAYVVGLSLDPHWSGGRFALGLVVVAAALAVLGRRVVGAVAGHDRALVPPVVAYMAAISAMVASAVATGDVLAVVGAGLFYASDTLIALDRFERARPWAGLAIMVTYHLGQLGLVLSLPG
jgi:uncharacterized membrane protein YhhN